MSKRWAWVGGLGLVIAAIGVTAEQAPRAEARAHPMAVMQWIGEGGEGGAGPTFMYAHSASGLDNKLVKGAPYSAEAVTEFVQTLADGNRITRKTTANLYRDSEGRTRREQNLGSVGPMGAAGEGRQQVLINDPVAGVNYMLNPKDRTARKLPALHIRPEGDVAADGKDAKDGKVITKHFDKRIEVFHVGDGPGAMPAPPPLMELGGLDVAAERVELPAGQPEALGKQVIEGVEAEGTRTTVTIPAGKIGNEQPLQIVTERWYSPELQTVVLSRHSDPRFGDTTYRLSGIARAEPQRTLFELPADYQLKEGPPPGDVVFRKVEKIVKTNDKTNE